MCVQKHDVCVSVCHTIFGGDAAMNKLTLELKYCDSHQTEVCITLIRLWN